MKLTRKQLRRMSVIPVFDRLHGFGKSGVAGADILGHRRRGQRQGHNELGKEPCMEKAKAEHVSGLPS